MVRETFKYVLLAGGLCLGPFSPAGAGGADGAMLANACAGCHGTDGVSAGPAAPTIAGMSAEALEERMTAYREGTMHSTIMARIAKGYTEEEVKAMAAHFAKLPFKTASQSSDAALGAEGKKLHKKHCEKCHEEGGTAGEDGARIAGQWFPYLHFTMDDYRTGRSEMPKKMAKKVEKLSDADLNALLHYYAGQK